MKLQLSLDFVDITQAKSILDEVKDEIDIAEIGTPFVIGEGIRAITEIKKDFPALSILADLKIMDAGEHEALMAFEAGADIVTVLGVSDDSTISGAVKAARKHKKTVMADMICVKDIESRALEIEQLGVDYICVHTAFDIQDGKNPPLFELQRIKKVVKQAKIAVAGGIKLETMDGIIGEKPDIVIVGGGITGKEDKREAARLIREKMNKHRRKTI